MQEEGTEIKETTQTSNGETVVVGSQAEVRKTVQDYLKDENVQKNLRIWAEHFNERFHRNWFTVAQVIKKTTMKDPNQVAQCLGLMILLGLAHQERKDGGIVKYKITLAVAEKVKLIRHTIETYQEQIALLEKEILTLEGREVADVVI